MRRLDPLPIQTTYKSTINMFQTIEEERSTIENIVATNAFYDNPEVLPWYETELEDLAPDMLELFREYSKIPSFEVVSHIKKVRDDAFKIVRSPLHVMLKHNSLPDTKLVSLSLHWQLDLLELQHPRAPGLYGSPPTRQEWRKTS